MNKIIIILLLSGLLLSAVAKPKNVITEIKTYNNQIVIKFNYYVGDMYKMYKVESKIYLTPQEAEVIIKELRKSQKEATKK